MVCMWPLSLITIIKRKWKSEKNHGKMIVAQWKNTYGSKYNVCSTYTYYIVVALL